jgi:hypothetical protein
MSDECMELKNIKYQTMLLNNNSKISETIPNILNIEKFLSEEKEVNKNKPWNKLNKGSKIKLIGSFSEEYQMKNNISDKQKLELINYLKLCIERKKLNKKQDLVYDKDTFKIISIQNLTFNKIKNKFTLKRSDKRVSSLKSLAPKNKTTKRNKPLKKKVKKEKRIKKVLQVILKAVQKEKVTNVKKEKVKKEKVKKEKVKKEKVKKVKVKKEKVKKEKVKKEKVIKKQKKNKVPNDKVSKVSNEKVHIDKVSGN